MCIRDRNKLGLLTSSLAFSLSLNSETMTLYKAFILPHLEYAASPLRMDWKADEAAKLESTNAFVLSVLLNVPSSTSYEELQRNIGALNKLSFLYTRVFTVRHRIFFRKMFILRNSEYSLRDNLKLVLPRPKSSYMLYSFSHRCMKLPNTGTIYRTIWGHLGI